MKHGHVQISYSRKSRDNDDPHLGGFLDVESLVGFNPNESEDRDLLHKMLDEFLDNFLVPKFNGENVGEAPGVEYHFTVFSEIDTH